MARYNLSNFIPTEDEEEELEEYYSENIVTDEDDSEEDSQPKRERKRYIPKKKSKLLPVGRVFGVAVALFLLVYFSMLVYSSNMTMLETEGVEQCTVSDYLNVQAYVLRDEEYVENTKSGILAYVIDDGESVNNGGTVAKIFNTELEVSNWEEYNRINNELVLLEQMSNARNNMFVDLDTVDAQILRNIVLFRNSVQNNSFQALRERQLSMQQLFNERAVITGGADNFSDRISELKAELDTITVSDSVGDVKSKTAGIFVSELDGYENALDFSAVDKIKVEDVQNVARKEPSSAAVGKVITSLNWYLLCPVTSEEAFMVSSGNNRVDISIPMVISGSIPGDVVGVNQSSKTEGGLLVIKCDYMDGSLSRMRNETISIKTKSYTGLKVARSAIHENTVTVTDYDEEGNTVGTHEEKIQGVYVMYGSKLKFVQVNIIYAEKDFVICGTDKTEFNFVNGETISLHDEVVVKGRELYDGKNIK